MVMQHMHTMHFVLALTGIAGGVLGLLFFGGLWWTLRRAFNSSRPALWIGGSMLLRMVCTATGFVLVSAGDWRRVLACLLGFYVARWMVVQLTKHSAAEPSAAPGLSLPLASGRRHLEPPPADSRVHGSP